MSDLFEEVEEQLRSERYRTLIVKAFPWVLGAAAVILIAVFGVWGWQKYRDQQSAKASEQYGAALEAMSNGHRDQALTLWTQVAKSPSAAYKSLALMQLGGLKLADRKTPDAVKLFDEAADAAPDAVVGDAARLKSAFALLDTAPEKDLEARLTPLMQDGHPYRIQAREALGFAKLMAGDEKGARGEFVVISQSLDANEGVRERAKAAMDLIDSGSAKAVPAVARAAAALPPPVMLAPGQVTPNTPPQPQAPGPQ
ncbi:tetratricopeptide repeat protein [Phenylobacterium sp.]|uniref:tetratricopeptide repeat protein n=1 Tax=Phenylobacterium sp. TaxID=1871053 RepID=UPI002DE64216|nr:tetratricopeptide repeat protein [Phenylobacterium sp.]